MYSITRWFQTIQRYKRASFYCSMFHRTILSHIPTHKAQLWLTWNGCAWWRAVSSRAGLASPDVSFCRRADQWVPRVEPSRTGRRRRAARLTRPAPERSWWFSRRRRHRRDAAPAPAPATRGQPCAAGPLKTGSAADVWRLWVVVSRRGKCGQNISEKFVRKYVICMSVRQLLPLMCDICTYI